MDRGRRAAVRQGEWFKGRQFTAEVILWAVHWCLMFSISYRDLELMFADCGVDVDHTTIFRWIQAYAPEKRIRPHLRRSNGSWRVDETHVRRMEGSHVEGEACGFRPGRSQHDALNALAYGISLRQVNWVAACSPKSDDIKAARSSAGLLPASPRTRPGSVAVERLIGAGRDGRPWDPNPPGAGLISPG